MLQIQNYSRRVRHAVQHPSKLVDAIMYNAPAAVIRGASDVGEIPASAAIIGGGSLTGAKLITDFCISLHIHQHNRSVMQVYKITSLRGIYEINSLYVNDNTLDHGHLRNRGQIPHILIDLIYNNKITFILMIDIYLSLLVKYLLYSKVNE